MDARARRSRESLRRAVLTLASLVPITEVSVSAICREAGVTRDTFYRHADSPADLLADALAAEIAEVMQVLPETDAIGDGERALIGHVHRRAAVYRGAMRPSLAAPVRSTLESSIRSGLELWTRLHPGILPAAFVDDDAALRLAIAYAAAGTVGAIEEWLRQEDDDIDRAVELILAASSEWWLANPATRERRER
ncbi:TetR family transcriptional regulator [Microbacterium sp. CIAB417]|uniref:TetR family transcriptional regulator n=1 Tax=Microbacterium sp. CIAB417 TaxID=2860287 RepID=UPI001FACAA85|nr:TetR family transcriptional regulator [Microbacterium sp. CIAB417]